MAICARCSRVASITPGLRAGRYRDALYDYRHLAVATIDRLGYAYCARCRATIEAAGGALREPTTTDRAGVMLADGTRCDGCGQAFHVCHPHADPHPPLADPL